jgi:hypothetical protein
VIQALPSAPYWTRSRSTTVSVPAGIGSPVSTQANEEAASRHRPAASAGEAVGPALIAMPSIAAQAERGAGQRARTGAAVTLPSPSQTGTCSAVGTPRHPAFVHAPIHCE